jgi:hypothetical protein
MKRMRFNKSKFSFGLVFFFCMIAVNAQENITVSGGTLSGIDGAVSYSVGQIFYITYSGAKGSITQGVQQPYEISPISSINEFDGIDLICLAYPNMLPAIILL